MCCLLVGITLVSRAQSGQKLSSDDKIKQLQKQLNLSDKQTAKIYAIYKVARVKLDSIITSSNGNKEATMNAMHPLAEATDKKIMAILTAKQAVGFEKLRKEALAKTGNGWSAS